GWKVKDFKGMTFEEIKAKFAAVWKSVKDFIPMGSKEEVEKLKRKGFNLEQEKAKKQKTSEVFFVDLLKHLDREDLNQLWVLVKEYLSIRPASNDKEMELWWKLYDLSGVHHVTAKDKEIFMLVEKDYPLRKGLALVMIFYKLQVENFSQMAEDLIQKIYNIANSLRQQGATTHVCNNRDLFKTYKETEDEHEVMMGDNHTLKVIGSGNVEIQFTSGKKLNLMNVLYVPNIRKNLVSCFKLCKSGVKAVIESDKVLMSKANVYVGKATMKDMLKQGIISYNGKHEAKCEICVRAKMKRKPFPKVDRQSEILELVHSDICELNGQLTRGGNRTSPYTPQQNDVAERKNKVLQDMINAMLVSANLLKNLWGEALLTACHVSNRITAKKLKVSPYEVWNGPIGLKSIFVGYAKDSKSYRCLDLDSNVIVESRDVDLFENKFHYDSTSTNEIVTQIPQDISGLNLNSNNKRNMTESSSAPRRSEMARNERNLGPDFIDSQSIIFFVEGDNKNNVINKIPVLLNTEDAPKTYKEAITSRNSAF
nr:hypothetical protein [Tanacetum cinerariifolium]